MTTSLVPAEMTLPLTCPLTNQPSSNGPRASLKRTWPSLPVDRRSALEGHAAALCCRAESRWQRHLPRKDHEERAADTAEATPKPV